MNDNHPDTKNTSGNSASSAALAIESIPALVNLSSSFFSLNKYQVLTTIENRAGHLLEPFNYHAAHGKLLGLQNLPVIPPAAHGGAPKEHSFPVSFLVGGRDNALQAPAVLCQWKVAEKNLYLMVFIYAAGGTSDHAGYFGLTTEPVDLISYWNNAVEGKHWYYYGDVARHCDATVGGIRATGTLSNNNPGSFVVNLDTA
jgi:hypothetical protein